MPLKPDKHPVKDFFIADVFDHTVFKDDMATMEHPLFSLSKKKDMRCLEYKKDNLTVSITPNLHGLPTIFDKDVLLYCGSLLMAEINNGIIPPRTLRISVRDLLFATQRQIGGDGYIRLKNALDRLRGATVKTNIKTNKREQTSAFGFIDSYDIIESSKVKNRMVRLEITFSEWFYNSYVGKEVLTVNRDYFRLGKPLERRLYEITRKHCGNSLKWEIGLIKLMEKTGSSGTLRKFRYFIKEISEDDHLPDYSIEIDDNDKVTFRRRTNGLNDAPLLDYGQLANIKGSTVQQARDIVRDAGTGWCFDAVIKEFSSFMESKGNPDEINRALIGFVKKKVSKRP